MSTAARHRAGKGRYQAAVVRWIPGITHRQQVIIINEGVVVMSEGVGRSAIVVNSAIPKARPRRVVSQT